MERRITCSKCRGGGTVECPRCNGEGCSWCMNAGIILCDKCGGSGTVEVDVNDEWADMGW